MDNYAVIIFVAVSILLVDEASALGQCRICRAAQYLDSCHSIQICGRDEDCYMDLKVTGTGNVEYWGGCRSKLACTATPSKKSDLVACSKCCSGDDCNTGLCNLHPMNITGSVRCLSCPDGVEDIRHCDNVVTCADTEMCYSGMMTVQNSVKLVTGCHRKEECTTLTMAVMEVKKHQEQLMQTHSLKRDLHICDICCGSELCNIMPCINIRDRLYQLYKHGRLNNNTLSPQIHHP